jgi:ribose transport system permease protein
MKILNDILETIKKTTALPAVILFVVLLLLNAIIMRGTLNYNFFVNFLNTNTAVICLSIGVSVVIIAGEIDISLGTMVSVANVLLIQLVAHKVPFWPAVCIVLFGTLVMGLLNGILVAGFRGSSLLITFATSKIFSGIALIIQSVPGGRIARSITLFYRTRILGFIPMTLIFVVIPFIIWKIYKSTPHGKKIYAVGASISKAYASGVNVFGEKLFSFVFAGFTAGMGAVAITLSVGAGDPLIGSQLSMNSLSAAVIGGVSLSGGLGDTTGGIFAGLFLAMITVLVMTADINPFMQQFVSALILLIGLVGAIIFSNLALPGKNKPFFVFSGRSGALK